jgi:acetyl esterase/lipase
METTPACDWSTQEKETKPFLAVRVSIRKDIVYGSDDTEKQTLDLYLQGRQTGEPNWFVLPEKPKPTVIHIHGGAWLERDKENEVMYFLPHLERGWNVVNVNYRLGDNTAPQAVDDVMCVLEWVSQNAEEYKIDKEAVILTGISAGGHLALISAFFNSIPDSHTCFVGDQLKIRAVVNWFGITDIAALESYLRIFPPNLNYPRRWIGNEALVSSISKQYSPVHHITPRSPPVLTFHGTQDMVVPYNQAVDLHERLDKAGVTNRLITMEDRNHGGFTEEECLMAFDEIFEFLAEHGIV